MALRRGNAVPSDPAAAKASTNDVDFDEQDDANKETERKTTPPPNVAKLKPADPPPAPDEVTSQEANTASAAQAATQVAAPATTAPVPAAEAQLPAERAQANTALVNSSATTQQQLEDMGFEGLNFGFGSFPIISLQNEGHFESSEGGSLDQEFYCVLGASKNKFIYKNNAQGKDEDFCYSYDQEFAVSGERLDDIIAAWKANGYTFEKKPYLDVQATLRTNDEDDGTLILLSVPKTSIPRFSGYVATQMAQGKVPSSYMTRVYMGDKVTKVKHPFYPWAFKFYADL